MRKPGHQQDDLREHEHLNQGTVTREHSCAGGSFTDLDSEPRTPSPRGEKGAEQRRGLRPKSPQPLPRQAPRASALCQGCPPNCSSLSHVQDVPTPVLQKSLQWSTDRHTPKAGGGLVLRPLTAPLLPTSTSEDRCRNNPNMLTSVAKAKITWRLLRRSIKERKPRRDRIPMIPRPPTPSPGSVSSLSSQHL